MKRFDVHVRPFDAALEQRPKVFKAVSVDVSLSVRNRMVDYVVNLFVGQFVVGTKLVRNNLRAFFHVGANPGQALECERASSPCSARAKAFPFALQQSEHSSFPNHTPVPFASFLVLLCRLRAFAPM